MRSRVWWLIAVVILVMLPIIVAGIGAAVLDPNAYKPQIIDAVQNATGRMLSLNGPVRLMRSLWPTIEVSDVTLANLPGGTRPDIARAERIEVQLSLPALLWHRIEVVRLTLVGPNILFEQVAGKPNWIFSPRKSAGGASTATSSTSPFQLGIRNVYIRNGMVTWRLPARTKVVGIRALYLQHAMDDGPLDMKATLVYSDNQPFSLQASAQPTAGLAGPWTTQLAFSAFDTTALAKGTMDLAGNYDLQVDAEAGALEKLNALLPEMRLPAVHRATLSTHLTNGPVPGDLPVFGMTRLLFDDADLGEWISKFRLGAVDVLLPAAGASATVAALGEFAGQPLTIRGTFGVPLYPDAQASMALDLKVQAVTSEGKGLSGSATLKGELTLDALRFGGLDIAIALRTPALAALRPLLSHRIPALRDVQFEARLRVPTNADSVDFHAARLLTQEGDLAGEGIIGLGAATSLDAKLRSIKLNLNAVLEAFGVELALPGAPASVSDPVIGPLPLPWAALRGPAIKVTGSIGALTFFDQVLQKVELALQLKDGRLQVATMKLALPEGPLDISMTADASVDPVPMSLRVHAPSLPLVLVARWAGVAGLVSGTMRIDAQLRAAGGTARDIAASLDGPVSATAIGGQLRNEALIKLTSASLEALGIKVPAQGETNLDCLGLIGSFTQGLGRFRTIALKTSYLTLAGVGQIDLGQETVAFRLNPLAQVSGSTVSVPVVVEGPFRAIQGRLDANGFDKMGLLVDAWFGGDHPDTCSDAGLVPARSVAR